MGAMSTAETLATEDGRRARRLRNRDAVVDALFDLITETHGLPSIEEIADRAGVSVSSIFRYFDGISDLQRQTMERYFTRYAELFEIPNVGEGSFAVRIDSFIDARMRLFATIAPIGRFARARVYDHPQLEESLVRARAVFTRQVHDQFAAELSRLDKQRAEDAAALIDVVCSFEGWELQHHSHGRSDDAIRRTWNACIRQSLNTSAR